jgi:hypothetical protein
MAILNVYVEGLKTCESRDTHEFPRGGKALRKSAEALLRKLRDSKLKWRKVDLTLRAVEARATAAKR